MRPLGPFTAQPHLAVAVSGGADSLALALLADAWARRRGGRITALTVDHGLRPEAATEARQVARWLRAAGIAHRTLRWSPPKGARANIQAKAREARYALLTGWCRDHGAEGLLVAHHQEDQAETFLLRLARGSGLDGLAAMAPVAVRDGVRLLRPLLAAPKAALVAFLKRRKQPWVEDPSNRDSAYARVRLRALLPMLAAEGLTAERLAETAARLGQARAALADACADLLTRAADANDAGYVTLDVAAFARAPREVALRALARLLVVFGGEDYTPRYERLCRLADELFAGLPSGRTLAGCRILPQGAGKALILREARGLAPALAVGRAPVTWDGRFTIVARHARPRGSRESVTIGALGEADGRALHKAVPALELGALPRLALPTLPALRDDGGLLAVPHLGWQRSAPVGRKGQAFEQLDDYVIDGPLVKLRNAAGFTLV
jgi:tRNA(Ile)-lysidine synthase